MPDLKIRKPKLEIPILTNNMNLYQAVHILNPLLKQRCIDCDMQCADCYLDYDEKIAIETILLYFKTHKKIISGYKTIKMKGI